jgi:hypothetical protein
MDMVDSESVAYTVTSPPYFNYIYYGGVGIGTESIYQDYLIEIIDLFEGGIATAIQ